MVSNHNQRRENKTCEWHSNQKRKENKQRKGKVESQRVPRRKKQKKEEEEEGVGKDQRREEEEGDDAERSWRRAGIETERELGGKKKEEEGRRRRRKKKKGRKRRAEKKKNPKKQTGWNTHTGRNTPKFTKMTETPWNFTRCGMGGYLIPVCISVRDFLAKTEYTTMILTS